MKISSRLLILGPPVAGAGHPETTVETLELTTEKMVFEGKALARQGRFVVFIEGALPGEKVLAEVTRRKRTFAEARVKQVLEPSPHRQTPPCPAFGVCGGCAFQHMAYPAQLRMKRDVLIESLHGVPGVPDNVRDILGVDDPVYFRNKMVYAFGTQEGRTVLGLHERGDWRSVVLTNICLLQSPEANEIINRTLEFVRRHQLPVFDDRAGTGLLRHLVIREGKHTGERMVHLHAVEFDPRFDELPGALGELCTTFVVSAHRTVPEQAPAAQTRVLTGPGIITEKLNEFRFEIGPPTFFQTNTRQAERLFEVVRSWAGELRAATAVDLYAGTGPIAIHLGAAAGKVVGIESVEESVRMARRNIELNAARNVEMLCAEVGKAPADSLPAGTDLVVVDPPRAGLHKKAMKLLLAAGAPHLIYVSCNPATLARDLKLFVEGGYTVETIQPVDMFPHTFHIEAVARLKRI